MAHMRKYGVAVGAVLLIATACGSDEPDPADVDAGAADSVDVTLTVFAAASLTETFTEIGALFEAENPGVTVEFSFDGSSNLVTQIQEGAPADVFASANEANMTKATDDDLIAGEPVTFATNVLEIVTPPDNPAGIETLADLTRDDITVVLCAPEVPCGAASQTVEDAAGIDIQPASEESNVTDVLNKVVAGEADAGLVYVTDITRGGDDVLGIAFPESDEAVNRYPIGALADSAHSDAAAEFVDFVMGQAGQAVLADAGFGQP